MEQEQVWDKIAPLWNEYKTDTYGNKNILINGMNLLEEFIDDTDSKILDLGCGSGRNFFKFHGKIFGVDFSEEQLKYAKINADKRGINVELFKSNAWELDFDSEFFDKALFFATLHCIEGKDNRMKSLQELYRVLKKGGKAIITVWNKDCKRWKSKDKEKMVSWDINGNKVYRYYYLYSQDELVNDLEKVGFKIEIKSHEKSRNIVLILEK